MANRQEYVDKLKAQLDDWNADIARWEAKAKAVQTDARIEYEQRINELGQLRDDAGDRLQHIHAAAGDAWLELTRGADDAWDKMRDAFAKARSRFQ